MNYELCKKLKDAGFNFDEVDCQVCDNGRERCDCEEEGSLETLFAPTLSELIEACGDNFETLYNREDSDDSIIWFARSWNDKIADGNTHEEAVANLWLELNK